MVQKFFSQLADKEKIIFYWAFAIVLVALFDRLFLGPIFDKLTIVDEKIGVEETNILRDLRFLTYRNSIRQEIDAFSKYFTSIKS